MDAKMSWNGWNEANVLRFLGLYRRKKEIWYRKHPHHFNRDVKNAAWNEIAENMGASVAECRKKMMSLFSSLRRERAKIRKSQATAKHADDVYIPTWFAFKSMRFLLENHKADGDENAIDESPPDLEDENDIEFQLDNTPDGDEEIELKPDPLLESSPTPPPFKKRKCSMRKSLCPAADTLQILPPTPATSSAIDDEECHNFAMFIASKLRKYSQRTRNAAQRAISNIIFEADEGHLEAYFQQIQPSDIGTGNHRTSTAQFADSNTNEADLTNLISNLN